AAGQATHEDFSEKHDTARVRRPDLAHFDDLAVDQLHPVVPGEDAHLAHPVVLIGGESSRLLLPRHRPSFPSYSRSPNSGCQRRESDTVRGSEMSFVTHIECTVCGRRHDAKRLLTVCEQCGQMLAVRYDLVGVKAAVAKDDLKTRVPGMYRFRE